MSTATLTSKGQITVPKAVREHLRLKAGERVEFVIADDGAVRLEPVHRSVRDLKGFLHRGHTTAVEPGALDESLIGYLAEEDERIRRGD
jgi:AbrB family looped-hinge helix DNA binding protein